MNPRLQRALMLLDTGRHSAAEQELRQALSTEPNDAVAHAALALCLAKREQFDHASYEAGVAIGLDPLDPYGFRVQASIFRQRHRYPEAEQAIRQAIALDPHDANSYALLGLLHLEQNRWQQGLEAAELGLQADPQNIDCANVKARALVQTRQPRVAQIAIKAALRRNPESAATHANLGWTLIEEGKHKEAIEHFREALRLEPDMEWARLGVIEALKAKRIIYRPILWYILALSKLSQRAQWGIVVGAFVGAQVLNGFAKSNPTFEPWVMPIIVTYAIFAFSTWMVGPLLNLFLLLDPLGRIALSRNEKITGVFVGLCVLGAVASLVTAALGGGLPALRGALVCAMLVPPISRIFDVTPGWPRMSMVLMTAALAMLGALAVLLTTLGDPDPAAARGLRFLAGLGALAFLVFMIGALGSQFAANALAGYSPKK